VTDQRDERSPVGPRPGGGAGGRSTSEGADLTGHPKGTLLIVGIYGFLFAFGWLVLYFLVFLPRGVLTE
jgi:hypothetical protein